jgi:hypothetical protein
MERIGFIVRRNSVVEANVNDVFAVAVRLFRESALSFGRPRHPKIKFQKVGRLTVVVTMGDVYRHQEFGDLAKRWERGTRGTFL